MNNTRLKAALKTLQIIMQIAEMTEAKNEHLTKLHTFSVEVFSKCLVRE